MRRTGFPPDVRAIILGRAGGRCERCGEPLSDVEVHHRRPRGAGGTRRPETNHACNGGALCGSCHRITESHRFQAYEEGWLVKQSQDPATIPVLRRGVFVIFDALGGIEVAA